MQSGCSRGIAGHILGAHSATLIAGHTGLVLLDIRPTLGINPVFSEHSRFLRLQPQLGQTPVLLVMTWDSRTAVQAGLAHLSSFFLRCQLKSGARGKPGAGSVARSRGDTESTGRGSRPSARRAGNQSRCHCTVPRGQPWSWWVPRCSCGAEAGGAGWRATGWWPPAPPPGCLLTLWAGGRGPCVEVTNRTEEPRPRAHGAGRGLRDSGTLACCTFPPARHLGHQGRTSHCPRGHTAETKAWQCSVPSHGSGQLVATSLLHLHTFSPVHAPAPL